MRGWKSSDQSVLVMCFMWLGENLTVKPLNCQKATNELRNLRLISSLAFQTQMIHDISESCMSHCCENKPAFVFCFFRSMKVVLCVSAVLAFILHSPPSQCFWVKGPDF